MNKETLCKFYKGPAARALTRQLNCAKVNAQTRKGKQMKFLIALLIVLFFTWPVVAHFGFKDTVQFTVEHRERVMSGNSSRFMVWGNTQGTTEVFENTDSWLALKFNSADLYGVMTEGAVCNATVTGLRIPFLSMNRNIIAVECQK